VDEVGGVVDVVGVPDVPGVVDAPEVVVVPAEDVTTGVPQAAISYIE